jgi:hypothetical protein
MRCHDPSLKAALERRLPAVWQAVDAAPLDVAGFAEKAACDPADLRRFHIPLAQLLIERAEEANGRFLVAVAGVPAGGKSVFAALMARVLRALEPPFGVAAFGLDGYHYPNAYLDSHPAPSGEGTLRPYKGAHFTFNALRLAADLRRLRGGEAMALPAYDRTRHDVAEAAIPIGAEDRLVLVEGNYLLYREGGWEVVADLFDLRIFLDLPPGVNRERMIARHMRGSRTREDAVAHFERTDAPNTALIAPTKSAADVVVRLDEGYRVVSVERGR